MKAKTLMTLGLCGLLLMPVLAGMQGCTQKQQDDNISHYTCPMHPHIHAEEPGECPICHMMLVPVYKDGAGSQSTAPDGAVPISPERQQMIGVKTATVQRQPVTTTIRTVGRVAFDPALAVAQQEFVEIARHLPSLKVAATSRLRLLGMSPEEIRTLERTRRPTANLYLPQSGASVWIYATLYQDELRLVRPGMSATIAPATSSRPGATGTIRAIDPVIDATTRTARARIEVPWGTGVDWRPDSYVDVEIAIDLGEALAVPASAVVDTGTRQLAFVVTDGRYVQPREIQVETVGDALAIIRDGLREGETVATSAPFLLDSETQLKAAIDASGSAPGCPTGEAWDPGMQMCMPKVGTP